MIRDGTVVELPLGKSERVSFVNMILRIIDRGQYSKNSSLAETVASTISLLSYVEPSLVIPFTASRFQLALETVSKPFGYCFRYTFFACPWKLLF